MVTIIPLSVLLDVPIVRRHRLHVCNVCGVVFGLSVFLVPFVPWFAGYAALTVCCSATGEIVRNYLQKSYFQFVKMLFLHILTEYIISKMQINLKNNQHSLSVVIHSLAINGKIMIIYW